MLGRVRGGKHCMDVGGKSNVRKKRKKGWMDRERVEGRGDGEEDLLCMEFGAVNDVIEPWSSKSEALH